MSSMTPLSQQISEFQQQVMPTLSQRTVDTLLDTTQDLVDSGIAARALQAGDACPAFELPNARGGVTTLGEKLAGGPLVISFYRGAWCPYCNLEIRALAAQLDRFRELGADLVAISPQSVSKAEQQSLALELDFDVLSDTGSRLAGMFGLMFELADEVRPVYDAFGFDLVAHNGEDNAFRLPVPATYIVDPGGDIRYAFVDADYTKRLEPAVIIEQLRIL